MQLYRDIPAALASIGIYLQLYQDIQYTLSSIMVYLGVPHISANNWICIGEYLELYQFIRVRVYMYRTKISELI